MVILWDPDRYTQAWRFAANAHLGQTVPASELPYLTHLGQVTQEVIYGLTLDPGRFRQPELAVVCAILHDTLEDTAVTAEQLGQEFGEAVLAGVLALTKDGSLASKAEKMADSLRRIQAQPPEIWLVKLGDRIANLGPPPAHWSRDKIQAYRAEAYQIHRALASAHPGMGDRLLAKIEVYGC